tara:strand:+ start:376 stop:1341 length:966 start_codon:yes stop_codon:yes gene_type:complete
MVKKYYPNETKAARKARKTAEKAGKPQIRPSGKKSVDNAPTPVPAETVVPAVRNPRPQAVTSTKPVPMPTPKKPMPLREYAEGFGLDHNRYIVCLKHGTKYSAEYVNVLKRMVTRNMTLPFKFVCFTEDVNGLDSDIQTMPLPQRHDIAGWWWKPYFFSTDLPLDGTILFMDLDVIVFENIDKLFTYEPGRFCIIRDFNRMNAKGWNRMNSSVFRLETGQHSHVYSNLIADPINIRKRLHGDQDWLFEQIKSNFEFFPDEWLQSYKWEMRGKPPMTRDKNGIRNFMEPGEPNILPETSVAVFHGEPNPPQSVDLWCKENWK